MIEERTEQSHPLQEWVNHYTSWADDYLAYAARNGLDIATQLDALNDAEQRVIEEAQLVCLAFQHTVKHLRHHIQRRIRKNTPLPSARAEFNIQWEALAK